MENGKLNHEEIICGSLAEAHDIASRHREHIIEIHDQIRTLVHYEDNIGQSLNIEIVTTEEPSTSNEKFIETTMPEVSTTEEPIITERVLETGSNTEVVTTEEPIIIEKVLETGATEVTIVEESSVTPTVPVSSVEDMPEIVQLPGKKAVVKKATVKK